MERETALPTAQRKTKLPADHEYSRLSDAELIPLVEDNTTAFSELYERYYHRVFYYLLDIVRNLTEAEDLTSQTFLSAFASLGKLKRKESFSAWLFRIARNKANDFFRTQRKRQEIPLDYIEEIDAELFTSSGYKKEDIFMVRELVNLLSIKEAELLRLRLVAELSFLEISEVLGKSVNKIKKEYYKILKVISIEWKDRNGIK